ncbi:MAG: GNAT family N-acetyltransferase [Lentisphaeria bacterium]|nr:GNAT family N-acetyltransferase [Candidatus Neomarinimicrobiota bacterium]MCF7842615.1 GNAT family N-acetyltransferase [Lentisphaeria bacterium]
MIKPPIVFESRRVNFRELCETDLEKLAEMYADPVTMRFIGDGTTKSLDYTRQELDRIFDRYAEKGYSVWATECKPSGELIGRSGLLDWMIEDQHHVEVAYLLARPWWRQGLGTEIARAIRDYAFRTLAIDHLISLIYPANIGSIGVAKNNGMSLVKKVTLFDNQALMYRIDRPTWESIQVSRGEQ